MQTIPMYHNTYESADDAAAAMVNNGYARIVFVAKNLLNTGYVVATHVHSYTMPLKRYMRDSRGFVSCKQVNNWKRN